MREIVRKYAKEKFLMVKNSLLELEKEFMELTDGELKDGKKKQIKREIKELLHKLITVSTDDVDTFEKQEMNKIRAIIRKWFDWLINTNVMGKKPELIRDKLKDKII